VVVYKGLVERSARLIRPDKIVWFSEFAIFIMLQESGTIYFQERYPPLLMCLRILDAVAVIPLNHVGFNLSRILLV
jgi:hypothetical protein